MSGLNSVLADTAIREELLDLVSSGDFAFPVTPSLDRTKILSIIEHPDDYAEILPGSEIESIVRLFGRPVLTIQNDTFETPASEIWRQRLDGARQALEAAIPSVGRIELKNHPSYDWVGTGWLVAEGILATNRHVAEVFSRREGDHLVFRNNFRNRRIGARIDFVEEYRQPIEDEHEVVEILHLEHDDGPDLALLRVEDGELEGRQPIQLAAGAVTTDQDIAVIGYPARDSRIPDPAAMQRIFGEIYDVKRLAPGKITRVTATEIEHDPTTLGGNSGSVLIDFDTGEAVGLHFAGAYRKANYAVPSAVVRDRLEGLESRRRVA